MPKNFLNDLLKDKNAARRLGGKENELRIRVDECINNGQYLDVMQTLWCVEGSIEARKSIPAEQKFQCAAATHEYRIAVECELAAQLREASVRLAPSKSLHTAVKTNNKTRQNLFAALAIDEEAEGPEEPED